MDFANATQEGSRRALHRNRILLAITGRSLKEMARACGFELAGVAEALPSEDFARLRGVASGGALRERCGI